MECSLKNITMHYDSYGTGQSIILLSGWGMSAQLNAKWWEPIFQERHHWKRIYLEPPGHGRTPGPDWITNRDQMLDVTIEAIDTITKGNRFVLLGHSAGGYLARGVLYHRRGLIDGLCLVVPSIKRHDGQRDVPPHVVLVDHPVWAEVTPAEAQYEGMVVVRSQNALTILRDFVRDDELGGIENQKFLEKISAPERVSFSFDVDSLSEPFEKPTLILTGRQDSGTGYRDAWRILENYPRATYVVFDRAGHLLEEKEELISTLVKEWLERVEESAGSR